MYLLAIDQGNSRTKFGLFAGTELRQSWTAPTDKTASAASVGAALLREQDLPHDLHLALCTVVPELLPHWEQFAGTQGWSLTIITGTSPTPLKNCYHTPETLGPDRLMAAVAAAEYVGVPVISVMLGTATVVDAASAEHEYLGGIIAPGPGTMAEALQLATSALPPVTWQTPAYAIGRSSSEAVANGLYFQTIGGLQAMIAALRAELGEAAPLALTGGWAQQIAPHLNGIARIDDTLVLRGIALTFAFIHA